MPGTDNLGLEILLHIKSIILTIIQWIQKLFGCLIGTNTNKKSENNVKRIGDIPGPKSWPFFGTTFSGCELNPLDLRQSNEENFGKYGPIFKHEYFWNIPIIAISNPEDIETICLSSDLRPPSQIIVKYRTLKKLATVGLVNLNGEEWSRMRKKTTHHILNTKFNKSLISAFDEMANDFVKCVNQKGPKILNASELVGRYTLEAVFYTFLGSRPGFLGSEEVPDTLKLFMKYNDQYFDGFSKSALSFPWFQYFPTKLWRKFEEAETKLTRLLEQIVKDTKTDNKTFTGLMDLLSKENLTPSEVNTFSLEFIMAGNDPVIHTLILTLYWISKHDRVQKKLYEELGSILPNKDSPIDEECINQLEYLQACMLETYRLCPSAPNLARITNSELNIQGYTLPPYTVVICQSWYSYLQEHNFYKAQEFIPERWLLNAEGQPNFLPHRPQIVRLFGFGRRICPGNKFASLAMKIALAKIFRNFKVQFLQDLEIKYLFLMMPMNSVDIQFIEHVK